MQRRSMSKAVALAAATLVLVSAGLTACTPTQVLELLVTTTVDGSDAAPGDGTCEMTVDAGDCSLRAAVDEANAASGAAVVRLPAGTYTLTPGSVEDLNETSDLDLSPGGGRLSILGSDARIVATSSGVLDVLSGSVSVVGVSITGSAVGSGIRVRSGGHADVALTAVHDLGDKGVLVDAGATASLTDVTISGNLGNGVRALGDTTIRSTTITDNLGGISGGGSVSVTASLVGDQAIGYDCAASDLTSGGANIDTEGDCGFDQPSDRTVADLGLGPLSGFPVPGHVPATGSPALDVGGAACGVPADQRGTARPQGPDCDSGAIEALVGLAPLEHLVTAGGDSTDAAPGDGTCDDGTGACTLRAAVDEANARPTEDTVTISSGVDPVLSLAGAGDDLNTTGDLDVTRPLILRGQGAAATTIDAGGIDRAIDVVGGALTLEDVTVTGGEVAGDGGGIRSVAALTVRDATVSANRADGTAVGGGGIWIRGPLVLERATVADNSAPGGSGTGGGIEVDLYDINESSPATITDSTIDGNSVGPGGSGGGLTVTSFTGTTTISGSTISGNAVLGGAAPSGGGLFFGAPHTVGIERTTVSGNTLTGTGSLRGAAMVLATDTTLRWVTVADNVGSSAISNLAMPSPFQWTCPFPTPCTVSLGTVAVHGSAVDGAIVEVVGDAPESQSPFLSPTSAGNVFTAAAAQLPTLDPADNLFGAALLLGPLADNGGATPTRMPGATSPLIDRIAAGTSPCTAGATDQRGVIRPQGSGCDAGAVEVD